MTTYLLFVIAEEAIQEVEGEEERPLALNVLKLHQLRGLVVQSVWVLQNKTSYRDGLNTYTHTWKQKTLPTAHFKLQNVFMTRFQHIHELAVLREWTFKDKWLACSSAERVNFQG